MKITKTKLLFVFAAFASVLAIGCQGEDKIEQTPEQAAAAAEEEQASRGMENYDAANNPDNRKE